MNVRLRSLVKTIHAVLNLIAGGGSNSWGEGMAGDGITATQSIINASTFYCTRFIIFPVHVANDKAGNLPATGMRLSLIIRPGNMLIGGNEALVVFRVLRVRGSTPGPLGLTGAELMALK